MDAFHYILCFSLFCLSVLSSPLYAEDVCVKKTPCSCEFSNGTGIDLSDSAKSSFYTAQMYELKNGTKYQLSTYYYHPCFDVLLNISTTIPGSTCGIPLTICRNINSMDLANTTTNTYNFTGGPYEFMGTSNSITFSPDGRSITYSNLPSRKTATAGNENRSTHVMLICAEIVDRLDVLSLTEPNDVILGFYSKNACLRQIDTPGRSTGSTLLIIFFSCVIFYLVLGVCTKKFLMGATGVEVVPNLAFWSDLPNLVKDGWAYARNGFKLPARGAGPATSPDPNSYDSI